MRPHWTGRQERNRGDVHETARTQATSRSRTVHRAQDEPTSSTQWEGRLETRRRHRRQQEEAHQVLESGTSSSIRLVLGHSRSFDVCDEWLRGRREEATRSCSSHHEWLHPQSRVQPLHFCHEWTCRSGDSQGVLCRGSAYESDAGGDR